MANSEPVPGEFPRAPEKRRRDRELIELLTELRQGNKERMLRVSNQLAIAGIFALAIGITAVVYLITALLYGAVAAVCAAMVVAGAIAGLWVAIPLSNPRDRDNETRHPAP